MKILQRFRLWRTNRRLRKPIEIKDHASAKGRVDHAAAIEVSKMVSEVSAEIAERSEVFAQVKRRQKPQVPTSLPPQRPPEWALRAASRRPDRRLTDEELEAWIRERPHDADRMQRAYLRRMRRAGLREDVCVEVKGMALCTPEEESHAAG